MKSGLCTLPGLFATATAATYANWFVEPTIKLLKVGSSLPVSTGAEFVVVVVVGAGALCVPMPCSTTISILISKPSTAEAAAKISFLNRLSIIPFLKSEEVSKERQSLSKEIGTKVLIQVDITAVETIPVSSCKIADQRSLILSKKFHPVNNL